ncbi:hypothetical protein COO60DRAFT_1640463 [Scenedesmus sp. NREL 46B-D3]|nr:hypothetical protein COO60DRAFT_1640463 [Scenedesmus sp. NREL 46B-D3]
MSRADTLVLLTPDLDPPLLGWSPISGQVGRALRGKVTALTRSLRRVATDFLADIVDSMVATDFLADIVDSMLVAEQLYAQGLFGLFHFPIMLNSALERYIYGQTRAEQRDHADQAQQMAERLLAMAGNAAGRNPRVATFLASYCALQACRCYKDPWQVKWEPQHRQKATAAAAASARAALARSNLLGASSSRVWPDIAPAGLPAGQAATSDQLLRWMEEGDATAKVARLYHNPLVMCMNLCDLTAVSTMLERVWDEQARRLSREMRAAHLAAQDTRAGHLRASGNEHFKAGRYEAALQASDYMAALSETPEDCRLYMNISLTHLRMGYVNEPNNSKAWVRLGDACREAGRWQLAALSYRAALDTGSAGDADVEVRLGGSVVPGASLVVGRGAGPLGRGRPGSWLRVGGQRPGHQAGCEHWLRKAQKEISKLHHTSRSIAVKLKVHVLNARALQAAGSGQLARLPALHHWQMSWGDMPMQSPVTGQIRYMVQVADLDASTNTESALTPAPAYLEGQPGQIDCISALALACFHPPNGLPPNKPKTLNLSYRMLTNYEQLREIFTEEWGIPVHIETKTEALRAGVQYDTHYMGRNFEDMAATAAQPGGSKKKKKAQQQQQQQQAQPGLAGVQFEDTEDGFVIKMPGSGPAGQQQQGRVNEVHCTLSEHIRQRDGGQGWGQVLGSISSGRVTQREVQQLSDMVKAL